MEKSPDPAAREAAIAALWLATELINVYSKPGARPSSQFRLHQVGQRYEQITGTPSMQPSVNPLRVAGSAITSAIAQGFLDLANAARVVADWFERRGRRGDCSRMHHIRLYWLLTAADIVKQDPNSGWPQGDHELAEARAALARVDENATEL